MQNPILLKHDGSESNVLPKANGIFTLEELQEFVGGKITMLGITTEAIMVMRENHYNEDLPVNEKAMVEFKKLYPDTDDLIHGDVLISPIEFIKSILKDEGTEWVENSTIVEPDITA